MSTFRRFLLLSCFALLLALQCMKVLAEPAQSLDVARPGSQTVTVAQYQLHLSGLHGLLSACESDPSRCDADKVGADDRVADNDSTGFNVSWSWLRELLATTKDAKLSERKTLLNEAVERLDEQARESRMAIGASAKGNEDDGVFFKHARKDADKVLAQSEFRHVTKNSYWEELLSKLSTLLFRMFGGVSSLGQHHPWLGSLIEWGFVALAFAALMVWVRRVMLRQRLAIRLESTAGIEKWQEASRNWVALAQSAAERSAWRDAIHALYWATITEFEGRCAWRQSSARTPREYLKLMQADSPQYVPLKRLTQILERVWYGLGPAARGDYDQALAFYEELRAA